MGETEYIFKHALTQEVAYNSVLIERRQRLHALTGAALETLYASAVEEHLAELAHHYGISRSVVTAGNYSTGAPLADRLLDLAQREGRPASFAFAYRAEQNAHFVRGDLVGAEEHFARLSGFLDAAGYRQAPGTVMVAIGGASICAAALGQAESAREALPG